jgi:hypothetical protein
MAQESERLKKRGFENSLEHASLPTHLELHGADISNTYSQNSVT